MSSSIHATSPKILQFWFRHDVAILLIHHKSGDHIIDFTAYASSSHLRTYCNIFLQDNGSFRNFKMIFNDDFVCDLAISLENQNCVCFFKAKFKMPLIKLFTFFALRLNLIKMRNMLGGRYVDLSSLCDLKLDNLYHIYILLVLWDNTSALSTSWVSVV